jgi:hypothetical protein
MGSFTHYWLKTMMNKRLMTGLLLMLCLSVATSEPTRATQLQVSTVDDKLLVDGQIALGITPTMESALLHGIALEYNIDIKLDDPERRFWQNPILLKRTRVKLSFDSLKQTYLLTNLSLQRFSTDRDLKRALMTLGAIQSLPLAQLNQLQPNHVYHLRTRVQLERDSLPNALRLSSLIDTEWRIDMDWQSQTWTYLPN